MNTNLGKIEGIAFDLDGTLVDSAPDLAMSTNLFLQTIGAPMLSEKLIAQMIGGDIETLLRRALAASLGTTGDGTVLDGHLARFSKYYRTRIFNRSSIYQGVQAGLEKLLNRGIRLACVTNKPSHLTEPLLEESNLGDYFSEVVCADDPALRKPSGAMLTELARRWQLPAERILMVGDSELDISSARQAGCPVVAVDYGYNHFDSLKAIRPDHFISSVLELVALRSLSASPGA